MTLDDIKARCHINDDGCWIWKGALSEKKWPRVWAPNHSLPGSPMRSQPGRRAVWNVKTGKAIPDGHRVYGTCDCDLCINPDHGKCGPTSDYGKHISKTGKFKGQPRRIAANRATGRKRSKTPPDVIQEILGSDDAGIVLAAKLGLTPQRISRVKNGRAGICWQPVGGLFSGLMAANETSKRRA